MQIETFKCNKIVRLKISNSLFLGNLGELEKAWREALSYSPEVIGLDFENVDFIDSSGLGTLVKFYNKSLELGFAMHLCSVSEAVKKFFERTRIDSIVSIITKEEFEKQYM